MQLNHSTTMAAVLSAALTVSVAGIVLSDSTASAAQPSWSRTAVELPATGDTFVSRESPQRAAGSRRTLVVRNTPGFHKMAYLKFVVPKAILRDAGQIESVILELTSFGSARSAVTVRSTKQTSWTEANMAFTNAPRAGSTIAKLVRHSRGLNSADLTATVRGSGTYAFQLTNDAGIRRFYSSESPAKSPTLTVTVRRPRHTPRPTVTPTTTPSPTVTPTTTPPPTATPTPTPTPTPTDTPRPTVTPTPSPTSSGCQPAFPGDRCGKVYYGAAVEGGNPAAFEASVGGKLSLYRSYMNASSPSSAFVVVANREVAKGEIPLISTKVPGTWGEVAAGQQDAWLLERIRALAQVPGTVWLCLHHEPSGDGAPADWVKMQQHARTLIKANSTNIALVGILNGWDFLKANATPEVWNMPVGTGVDVMGFDSYNQWSPTNGKKWQSASVVLSPAVTIAGWGYPTVVGEYGVRNDPANPGKAALWMTDAYKFAVANKIAGMAYFNSGQNSPDGTWALDGERLNAFGASLASSKTN